MAMYMDPAMMEKMNKLKAVSEEEIMKKLDKAGRLPGGSAELIKQRMKAEAARAAEAAAAESEGTTPAQSKNATIVKPVVLPTLAEGIKRKTEELVGGSSDDRNYKGIAISLLVIIIILGAIVTAVIIITPEFYLVSHTVDKFTFDDIFDPRFIPKRYDVDWLTGDTYIRKSEDNSVVIAYLNSNDTSMLITNRTMEQEDINKYWVDSNIRYMLLGCSVKKLYRHSFTAVYKLYDIDSKEVLANQLKPPGMKDNTPLQYASWSPTGEGLVFVYGNNIYYQESVSAPPIQLTDTGVEGDIFNGIPDWVYEEEMLESNSAIYWGPESTNLVYGTFDDTNVKRAWYPDYNNNIYSKVQEYAYPKAGETNPNVTLYVYDLQTSNKVMLEPPEGIREREHYYQSVTWIDKYKVAVVWINRPQNYSVTTICQVDTGSCDMNHDYSTNNGWVVMRGPPVFSESGQSYVYIYPRKETGIGNYFHIALHQVNVPVSPNPTGDGLKDGNKGDAKGGRTADRDRIFLTKGTWEVTEILAFNETARVVYYMSTETSPHDRHLYNVSIDHPYKRHCMSCGVRDTCTYFTTSFSKDLSWYKLHCLGPGIPQVTFHNMHTGDIYIAEDNKDLADRLEKKAYPAKEIRTVKLDDGSTIYIQLWKPGPKQFDDARRHPLLVDVYAGPGSQKVNNIFELGWNAYLSSRYYVIVASIDGRGAGFYGENNLYALNRQLGTVEIEDQIKGVKYLSEDKMIDPDKIGIWGWSYGGFATTSILGRGTDYFKCGIAVAPVTDWRYYDSIYTERYMGMPYQIDNLQAYKDSNVSALADKLHNSRLLLIHGTADDNVHFQNSADLVRALVQEEIVHQTQYYPDERHSLMSDIDPKQRHLYRLMIDHLDEFMDLPPIV